MLLKCGYFFGVLHSIIYKYHSCSLARQFTLFASAYVSALASHAVCMRGPSGPPCHGAGPLPPLPVCPPPPTPDAVARVATKRMCNLWLPKHKTTSVYRRRLSIVCTQIRSSVPLTFSRVGSDRLLLEEAAFSTAVGISIIDRQSNQIVANGCHAYS